MIALSQLLNYMIGSGDVLNWFQTADSYQSHVAVFCRGEGQVGFAFEHSEGRCHMYDVIKEPHRTVEGFKI